jgi:hypothetical protein
MSTILTETFTTELTNNSITLTEGMGVRAITVYCTTTTSGTVTGSQPLGSISSSAITITQNTSFNQSAIGTGVLTGLTITAPASCTLIVVAQI